MRKQNRTNSFVQFTIIIFFVLICSTISTFAIPPTIANVGAAPAPKLNNKLSSNSNLFKELKDYDLLNLESNGEAFQQGFDSAFKIGGTKVTQIGATVKDAYGNFYVTGGYTGTIDFGSSSVASSGGYDFYVAKYDPSGNNIWFRVAIGATGIPESLSLDGGISIAIDDLGNCYVGGAFVKNMTFLDANGQSLVELSDGKSDGTINFEMFIAKYTSSGELMWAKGGNSGSKGSTGLLKTGLNSITSIILDSEGYPYIGGSYSGSNFLDENVTTAGLGDFFLAGLDKSGNLDWVKFIGTPDNEGVMSLSVDSLGYINVIGTIGKGEISLPDTNAILHTNNSGTENTFIISFDINGNWYFASFIDGSLGVRGYDIASDAKGNIFVSGEFVGDIDTGEETQVILSSESEIRDGFVTKFDLNGNALWARSIGGEGSATIASRVEADEDGSCIVTGTFENEITIGKESADPVTMLPDGGSDMFIAKYDSSGNFLWATKLGGSGSESLDLIQDTAFVNAATNPVQLYYSNKKLTISGDFSNTMSFGNINLEADADSRAGFITTLDLSNIAVDVKEELSIVPSFSLSQNYPNPFNPSTVISYQLPEQSEVNLKIYDLLGEEITTLVNELKSAGSYKINFNAENLSSGIYFYTLKTPKYSQSKKMMLVK